MAIAKLEISHFRNLEQVSLSPSPHVNIIVGKNGSGKTSLLEAINFLGSARSFRTPHSKQLISFGHDQFVLFAQITAADVSVSVGISKDQNAMNIKVANRLVASASILAELLPIQIINPDVHKLLEEGPRYRRRFIEWGVFHVKPNYLPQWQQCRHILKQRNAALKQNLSVKEIDHWDLALIEITESITAMRQEYLTNLQPYIDSLMDKVTGLPKVQILLEQGWPKTKPLKEALSESLGSDRSRGFTQYGPHRADLKILVGNLRAKDVVSRGQQKLITSLMKLAQAQYLENLEQGSKVVLLVDDLPAELDLDFRDILISEIEHLPMQSFVTTTDKNQLPLSRSPSGYQLFHVEHGQFHSQD